MSHPKQSRGLFRVSDTLQSGEAPEVGYLRREPNPATRENGLDTVALSRYNLRDFETRKQRIPLMDLRRVMIFGDSYSTFRGYIPEGYDVYYSEEERPETDVTKVTETWWYPLFEETNATLVQNNSWSGSTISYTGYAGDCSETSSFLCRLKKLTESCFFSENPVDTMFVFGGTNDSWVGAPVGTLQYADWKREDLFSVLPAVCCFLDRLTAAVPNTRILFLVNTELKTEIAEGIQNACAHWGVECLTLTPFEKRCGHPTVCGMAQIKEQVMRYLESKPARG